MHFGSTIVTYIDPAPADVPNTRARKGNDQKVTIIQKIKIRKILFFFLFSRFQIYHVNLETFEKKYRKF